MLSEKEKNCALEFFEDFPSADLFALALLISKRNLQPSCRNDALNIICQHVDRIESLLEKKKVSKAYICHYLHGKKVSITMSWDKPALIRKVLDYWNSNGRLSSPQEDQAVATTPAMMIYYNELISKFSEWFYGIINDPLLTDLRAEHFFVDAELKISIVIGENTEVMEAGSAGDVVTALHQLQSTHHLLFSPNLSPDAFKYQTNVYGHLRFIVGGTLHSSNISQVVGVFEQAFLLVRDVSADDNWKIRSSQIMLRNTTSIALTS